MKRKEDITILTSHNNCGILDIALLSVFVHILFLSSRLQYFIETGSFSCLFYFIAHFMGMHNHSCLLSCWFLCSMYHHNPCVSLEINYGIVKQRLKKKHCVLNCMSNYISLFLSLRRWSDPSIELKEVTWNCCSSSFTSEAADRLKINVVQENILMPVPVLVELCNWANRGLNLGACLVLQILMLSLSRRCFFLLVFSL